MIGHPRQATRSLLAVVVIATAGCGLDETKTAAPEAKGKIYVANEDDGTVSVIDEVTFKVVATIDLADPTSPGSMPMPHNVQAAPDGGSVWVTAPPMEEGGAEEAIVIDPATDSVVGRVALGTGLHVAHVVFDPTSRWAYVTANEGEALLRIDADALTLHDTWSLGAGNTPHGLRWCAGKLYVADMAAGVLSIVDPTTGESTQVSVGGLAVQTACVADTWVFASLFDTREVVRYAIDGGEVVRIGLPPGAEGPIQLYGTRDGTRLFTADQGILMNRPASNRFFEIDVATATVTHTVEVGAGAHGVVLDEDGRAWITNTADNTVSVVDTSDRQVVATIPVGTKPNGVSCWHPGGGMP
jgi:YVTN family beta-propeller protein